MRSLPSHHTHNSVHQLSHSASSATALASEEKCHHQRTRRFRPNHCQRSIGFICALLFVAIIGCCPLTASAEHHHHHHHTGTDQQRQLHNEASVAEVLVPAENTVELSGSEGLEEVYDRQQPPALSEERSLPFPSAGRNLFREYISRGIFTCTSKYIGALRKLNKLIATAHEEYSQCEKLVKKADGEHKSKKLQQQLDMINELLSE